MRSRTTTHLIGWALLLPVLLAGEARRGAPVEVALETPTGTWLWQERAAGGTGRVLFDDLPEGAMTFRAVRGSGSLFRE